MRPLWRTRASCQQAKLMLVPFPFRDYRLDPYLLQVLSPLASTFLVRMSQRFSRLKYISDALLLQSRGMRILADDAERTGLTRTFSSGKPLSTFLSHIKSGSFPVGDDNQMRNRPAVSSSLSGIKEMQPIIGGGNVKSNSVCTQLARCSLRRCWKMI